MKWPLYTDTLSTEDCVGVVVRRKSLPLSEKQTEIVIHRAGNYTDGGTSATNIISRFNFLRGIWLYHKAGFTNVSLRKDRLQKYISQRHKGTDHNY
jgi:hypothetical protein